MNFLKLIRYQNLILLAVMQLVFHFGFLKKQLPVLGLTDWQFLLLVLSTICIAGGGYLINDVFDKDIDKINKPEKVIIDKYIPEKVAYNYYVALNLIGVGIGFYLSNLIEKPNFSGIFILVAATLYIYASSLKKSLFIGNIIVAVIFAISILIVGIYDLLPVITPENKPFLGLLFGIIIDFAGFTFFIYLIREIVKNFENINGGLDQGAKTIPIVFGEKKGKIILSLLLIITIVILFWYTWTYMYNEKPLYLSVIYIFALILGSLIYVLIRLWSTKEKKEYSHLSLILKLIVLFGIISVLVIEYNKKIIM